MNIRKATESDIPKIIELLKLSLGESMIPKSEVLWKWKHLYNPFGKSPVLIAEEGGTLIGVRAFLRWEFWENGKIHKACRAVDTATHPDHEGKGIFKNLTLALIEDIKKEGVDLIFNTPNAKSTPGYLKMEWEKWGKLPLKLNFHFNKSGNQKVVSTSDWDSISKLIRTLETTPRQGTTIQTRIVPGYLNWRFRDNPLFSYQFLSDGENYLLVYRIKDGKMGREFRICDLLLSQKLSKSLKKDFQRSLNKRIEASGSRFSSFSGLNYPDQKILEMGLIPIMKIGPVVTLRKVRDDRSPIALPWAWSLGDLEMF